MKKYQELHLKIINDIDLRVQTDLRTLSIILKRAKKLIEAQKLKSNKKQPIPSLEDNEMYQVMKM